MLKQNSRRRISFVTGINENYFLLCGMLMESLERHFPLIPFYVADFGMSEAQQEFFRSRGMLLPRPAGMKKDDHPFNFKGNLGASLNAELGMPIWIDADIIAVSDGTQALFELAEAMAAEDARFAIATDRCAPDGKEQTLACMSEVLAAPLLRAHLAGHPALGAHPYLNTGWVMFRATDALDGWHAASAALEGDQLWEQNAFNLLCHGGAGKVRLLDARAWNMHGSLLDKVGNDAGRLSCDGVRCIFAHAASPHQRQVSWGEMEFMFAGLRYKNFVKFFAHPALHELQKEHMNSFLSSNLPQLRELGIMTAP